MGMGWPQQLDVRLDGKLLKRFIVGGGAKGRPAAASYAGDGEPGFAGDPEWEEYMQVGGDARPRSPCAGSGGAARGRRVVRARALGAGRPAAAAAARPRAHERSAVHGLRQRRIGADWRPVRRRPGRPRDTPSRARCSCASRRSKPKSARCATRILSRIARLAYRRPVTNADVATLLTFFADGRRDGGSFDAGIQFALERVLVDPDFLLRVHRDPPTAAARPRTSQSRPIG